MNEAYFKDKLNPEQYRVMRQKGTETAYSGEYWEHTEPGIYLCAACNNVLFISLHKFNAKNGWPSFTRPASLKNFNLQKQKDGRTEVSCKKCESHLGYIERDDDHYTVNSIALQFQELPDIEWPEDEKENDEKQEAKKPSSSPRSTSAVKTITFTLGGLTLGIAAGAYGMSSLTPTPLECVQSPIDYQQEAQTPVTTAPTKPTTTTPSTSSPATTEQTVETKTETESAPVDATGTR